MRARRKAKSQISLAAKRSDACINLQFVDGRYTCVYGRKLSLAKDNSISARRVLYNIPPAVCRSCELYREEIIRCG